jgi:hypothetical protein
MGLPLKPVEFLYVRAVADPIDQGEHAGEGSEGLGCIKICIKSVGPFLKQLPASRTNGLLRSRHVRLEGCSLLVRRVVSRDALAESLESDGVADLLIGGAPE